MMKQTNKILLTTYLFVVLAGSSLDFFDVAWGTGIWLGNFSLTWALLFIFFCLLCLILFTVVVWVLWQDSLCISAARTMVSFRRKLGWARPILILVVFVFPVWFLQFSVFGLIFYGFYLRLILWTFQLFLLSFLTTTRDDFFIEWNVFLFLTVITASFFSVMSSLSRVTGYPFSLSWSEGNRIWDYSVVFGRDLYDYPSDASIPVLLDPVRQWIGGLPFLIPGLTLWMERLWISLTQIIPYFLVGFAVFRSLYRENKRIWIVMALWVFLFLKQGPIHASLVISAAMVALAWQASLWVSIPLLVISGYFAQASRFSWVFAPGMWIVMLEFSYTSFLNGKLNAQTWIRSVSLGFAGIFGGYLLPKLLGLFNNFSATKLNLEVIGDIAANSGLTSETISHEVTHQPLLWYRLLPNSTYENGILLGLLIATGPLLVILFYLAWNKIWPLLPLQKLVLILPLLAFLVVGLIASTKIGGGGDLHNLDMFLIGLSFTAAVAFKKGGFNWVNRSDLVTVWMKVVVMVSLLIPTLTPLNEMRSYEFGEQLPWLIILRDVPKDDPLEMLPTRETVRYSLQVIQEAVNDVKPSGEVLFIDQRQLLTFGYILNVPLIPEYEKKMLMNQALSSDMNYFEDFYHDLAMHRFQLIVSEPLKIPTKGNLAVFGEENNAWVKWVSIPVLCYYQEKETLQEVGVQLLVPKQEPVDCTVTLP